MAIGRRVGELRRRSGVAAEQLARRIGLSPSSLSRLEHGERYATAGELVRIAVALRISPLEILGTPSLEMLGERFVAALKAPAREEEVQKS